jgi:hypothetical protein
MMGCIHMPSFVGLRGAYADSRLWGVEAASRPTPAALADELGPRGDRGKDLADTLGVEGEGTQRHVAVLGSEHHALDGGDLHGRELAGVGAWAGGAIVEGAGRASVPPGMVASRFEAEEPEDESKRKDRLRAFDGAEDIRLGRALGESPAGKAEPRDAEQGEQEANDGGQNSGSTLELGDGLEEMVLVLTEGLDGHDRTQASPLPGRDGGARDGDMPREESGAGSDHMFAQAVVISATHARSGGGSGRHRGRTAQHGATCRKPE